MEHVHGTMNYRGDVEDDLMGKVFGPGRYGLYFVVTNTEYNPETNLTAAEMDQLTIENQPAVVMQTGAP